VARIGIDREVGGERQRALFQALDAQEIVAQRLVGRCRGSPPQPAGQQDSSFHECFGERLKAGIGRRAQESEAH
jgi:hypothetical protein